MKDVLPKKEDMSIDEVISEPLMDGKVVVSSKVRESFLVAFDDLAPQLYRFALLRVGLKHLAEDLVSDTFLKTWEYLSRGETVKSYRTFLYRVLHNLIIDHWRSKLKREIFIDDDLAETLIDPRDLPEELAKDLEISRVTNCLRKLPANEAYILYLRFVDDFSIKEIADLTSKKPNAIYVSIHRGLKNLKNNLKDV